jgi:hypothetical protein
MTTYTTKTDGRTITASGGSNAAGTPAMTVLTNVYDAAERPMIATDVAEVLAIPAHTFVHTVFYEVLNGEAAQTMDLGTAGGTDYGSAVDVATTGNNLAGAYTVGSYFATADTIDITVPSAKAYTTLKVRVSAAVTLFG